MSYIMDLCSVPHEDNVSIVLNAETKKTESSAESKVWPLIDLELVGDGSYNNLARVNK